jgi:hypothetical protein
VRKAMGGEQPRRPQMVSVMDGSSELQFNPESPSHLYGKTKINLGVIDTKGQISAAKISRVFVGHMCIKIRASTERDGREIFRYASWCYVDMVEVASC